MDCLTPVTYPTRTLVNASYIADNDGILYAYGHAAGYASDLGFFSALPADAVTLVKADSTRTPTEGFVPTNTAERAAGFKAYMNNSVQAFAYDQNGMNTVFFANSLTHKVQQRDEYAFISNFLFSSMLGSQSYAASDGSASTGFTDVKPTAYYADSVAWAVTNKITEGIGGGKFGPDVTCSRAQVVTFLWRAAGSPVVNYAMSFSDVAEGKWYTEAVRWAASDGITAGLPDGSFGVNDACTRAQVVTFLFRFAVSQGLELVTLEDRLSGFSDHDQVGSYAVPAMNWAIGQGILQGSGGKLMPNDSCTRAQTVTFLFRSVSK